MENKMITAEMKEKMFEAWWETDSGDELVMLAHESVKDISNMSERCSVLSNFWAKQSFTAALDLILPLLEQSLEANEFYMWQKKYNGYSSNKSGEWEYYPPIIIEDIGKTARQAIATIESELKQLGGRDE
jgi:hypothetical protein